MAREIERKFLVISDDWKASVYDKKYMRQGYICNSQQASVRIRIENQSANINIKSMSIGISRAEYEYPINLQDATEMLDTLCGNPVVQKERFLVKHAGKVWEVDVFMSDNRGLIVAEVELDSETETIQLPSWVGREVSNQERYYNMRLAQYPYSCWTQDEKQGG